MIRDLQKRERLYNLRLIPKMVRYRHERGVETRRISFRN